MFLLGKGILLLRRGPHDLEGISFVLHVLGGGNARFRRGNTRFSRRKTRFRRAITRTRYVKVTVQFEQYFRFQTEQ